MKSSDENNPLVSIVAVCFNHARFVVELLESINAQTYNNIELIILDDCSTDNSVEVIENWIHDNSISCTFTAHKTNVGLCRTLNEALSLCEGKYLQLIACDDILLPTKIQMQVEYLEKNHDYSMVCSNFESIDEDGRVLSESYYQDEYEFPDDPFKAILDGRYNGYHIVIHSPTVLVKKNVIDSVGGFLENIMQEDFYMWLQITHKEKVGFQNINLVKYRKLDSSLSVKLTTDYDGYEKYLKDHIKVIGIISKSAIGKQLFQLIEALVVRYEKLERLYIDNHNNQKNLEIQLSGTLNEKNKLIEGYPEIKKLIFKSILKTTIYMWKKNIPLSDNYKQYMYLMPIGYRLAIGMNVRYETLSKIRKFSTLK